ncbi:MAG: polysaccharide deacetylase family protein [Aquificae bacterium]|nr:polysaccharide deacetylase family protein [Aquificota bacterium]
MKNNIFILLYHKILPRWGFDVAVSTFDWEMKLIKQFFNVITLDDVYEYISTGKTPDKPSVVITFDDGYVDNFVYAYPILKKYGLKATIFPITSRINKEETVRHTLEDYWSGKVSKRELIKPQDFYGANYTFLKEGKSDDFLTIEELNKMKDVFEIGGHAEIHAKVFHEDTIVDFYDGKNGHWSNIYAYGKSDDFSQMEEPKIGYPLFPDRNNLAVRRGFLKEKVKDFINSIEDCFFKQKNWKEELKKELYSRFDSFLEFETQEHREKRLREELIRSKKDLEEMIGEKIRHFAYPFGHYDELLVKITSEIFDTAYTVEKGIVSPEMDFHRLPRMTIAKDFISFLSKIIKGTFSK